MKKIYLNPTTEIIKIDIQRLLTTSDVGVGNTPTDPATSDSRRRNRRKNDWDEWDEEEEEEF